MGGQASVNGVARCHDRVLDRVFSGESATRLLSPLEKSKSTDFNYSNKKSQQVHKTLFNLFQNGACGDTGT